MKCRRHIHHFVHSRRPQRPVTLRVLVLLALILNAAFVSTRSDFSKANFHSKHKGSHKETQSTVTDRNKASQSGFGELEEFKSDEPVESNQDRDILIVDDKTDSFPQCIPDDEKSWTVCNVSHKDAMVFWDALACGKVCSSKKNLPVPECARMSCPGSDCQCDWPECSFYDDCCADAIPSKRLLKIPPQTKYASCLAEPFAQHRRTQIYSYFVLLCPLTYEDDTIRRKCEENSNDFADMSLHVPVYSPMSERNYKNLHCAKCHSDDGGLVAWENEVTCMQYIDVSSIKTEKDLFPFFLRQTSCSVIYRPPLRAVTRRCKVTPDVINGCNVTGQWQDRNGFVEKACHLYTNVVKKTKTYKNIFCASCNGFNLSEIENCVLDSTAFDTRVEIASFSVVFNFRSREDIDVGDENPSLQRCQDEEVFDPYKGQCRQVVCSKGRFVSNHTCVPLYQSAKGVGYMLQYRLRSRPIQNCSQELSPDEDAYSLYISSEVQNMRVAFYSVNITPISCVNSDSRQNAKMQGISGLNVELRAVAGSDLPLAEFKNSLLSLNDVSWQNGCKIWFSQNSSEQNTLGQTCHPTGPTLSRQSQYYPVSSAHVKGSNEAYIILNSLTDCTQIEFNDTEYNRNDATGTIVVSSSNATYFPGQYELRGNSVRVCTNFRGWYEPPELAQVAMSSRDRIERILTLSSFVLSLCGLFLAFIVTLWKPSLKTVPTKISLALVVSLFTAQVMFLVGADMIGHIWTCRVLGLMIHFSWLTVFCWQSVSAYHMYRMFVHPLSAAGHPIPFRRYCLFAHLSPVVLVSVYITIHMIITVHQSDGLKIGYGDTVCFLSRPIDVGLAFALPVGIVLVSNGCFFIRTVLAIRQMSSMQKHSSKADIQLTASYVKMFLALGFTWIIGFLANAINTPYMWFAFIVVNGSLGLFIFINQVCNRQTLNLIGTKFGLREARSISDTTEPRLTTQSSVRN